MDKIKFIHLRRMDIATSKIWPLGGCTIAYKNRDIENGTIEWGYAICRNDEHYVKSFGREMASSRMKVTREWEMGAFIDKYENSYVLNGETVNESMMRQLSELAYRLVEGEN